MEDIKVSIIIPTYNCGDYIKDAILSVRVQLHKNIECIIVDDGSTDNTEEVVKEIVDGDARFTYYKNENHGVAYSRNFGASKATGKYLIFLDADDFINYDYVLRGITLLEKHPDYCLYYSQTMLYYHKFKQMLWGVNWVDYKDLLICNRIYISAIMKREDFERTGGFDETLENHEDWDFFIRLLYHNGKVYQSDRVLFYYRQREGGRNENSFEKYTKIKPIIKEKNKDIYKEYEK